MLWIPSTTPNFSPSEMACKCGKCGGRHDMRYDFMIALQYIRDEYGPMTVTSGFRCPLHPAEKKKNNPGSHAQGRAADIYCTGAGDRFRIIQLALKHKMQGIGFSEDFIHLDNGHDHMARPAFWDY